MSLLSDTRFALRKGNVMCYTMPKLSNHVVQRVCEVGDLVPGQTYRDPDGNTLMMLDLSPNTIGGDITTDSAVVCLDNGRVLMVHNDIQLGYDQCGRLYAARRLNPQPTAS